MDVPRRLCREISTRTARRFSIGSIDVGSVDDHSYLVVMIFGGIEDGDVARIQCLSRALEAVVNLVGHCQTGRACPHGEGNAQQSVPTERRN